VAAALEVRGYALAGRRAHQRAPWSRHDLRIAAAALAVGGLAIGGAVAGVGRAESYPTIELALGPAELALAAAFVLLGVAPLAGRTARLGVARA
jgi:hypothetical protein